MFRMLFWRLRVTPGTKISSHGEFDYYNVLIDGYLLMYAKNRYRPDGLRLYVLGDELARCLGFVDYIEMRRRIRMQYSRRMLSVQALERHFC